MAIVESNFGLPLFALSLRTGMAALALWLRTKLWPCGAGRRGGGGAGSVALLRRQFGDVILQTELKARVESLAVSVANARRHGARLVYSEMLMADAFASDASYRATGLGLACDVAQAVFSNPLVCCRFRLAPASLCLVPTGVRVCVRVHVCALFPTSTFQGRPGQPASFQYTLRKRAHFQRWFSKAGFPRRGDLLYRV